MKRFFCKKISKEWYIEVDILKYFGSLGWFPIITHNLDIKAKGSHKGLYWILFLIGFKIFELNIYSNKHDDIKYDPIIDY